MIEKIIDIAIKELEKLQTPTILVPDKLEPQPSPNKNININKRKKKLITTDSELKFLNDPDIQDFEIAEGFYSTKPIITQSGSKDNIRTIVGNGMVNLELGFQGASHWLVEGLTVEDRDNIFSFQLLNSSNNTFRELTFKNFGRTAISIGANSNDNIIEDCRFLEQQLKHLKADGVAVQFTNDGNNDVKILGNIVKDCEFYNCNDGVQLVRYPIPAKNLDYGGTQILNNKFHIDRKIYTQNGTHAYAENGLDLKVGGSTEVKIFGNLFRGYRVSETYGTSLSDTGSGICGHMGIENVRIENNRFEDCSRGITVDGISTDATKPYSANNLFFVDNTMKDIIDYGMVFFETKNTTVEENSIIMKENSDGRWAVDFNSKNIKVGTNYHRNSLTLFNDTDKEFTLKGQEI